MSAARTLAAEVDARLRVHTDPLRREFTQDYFPSALENLGVAVPAQRAIVRDLKRRLKSATGDEALAVVRAILRDETLEGRQVAYLFVPEHPGLLPLLKAKVLAELGEGIDNWTSVDTFGCYVAGPAWRAGVVSTRAVLRWTRRGDRWWRRAALAATVALNVRSRGGNGDTARTLPPCVALAGDPDDMVVKGLSWALRSLAGTDPVAVRAFLDEHDALLHARVKREVRNKLGTGLKNPGVRTASRRKA